MDLFIKTVSLEDVDLDELRLLIEEIMPEANQCYYNARNLTLRSNGKYSYYEGAIWQGSANTPHAWNMLGDAIVDITPDISGNNFCLGELRDAWRYAGMEFPLEVVKQKDNEVGGVKGKEFGHNTNESSLTLMNSEQRKEAMTAVLDEWMRSKFKK